MKSTSMFRLFHRSALSCATAFGIGLAVIAAASSSANAQGYAAKSWSGFYVGAGVGAGAINHQLDISQIGGPAGFTFDGIGGEGMFATIQLGADVQVSQRFVVGVFVDYDFSGMKTNAALVFPPVTASGEIPVDDMWTIGARFGYLSSPSTLWYAGAGYSHMRLGNASGSVSFGGPPVAGSFPLPDFGGYSLIAGVESQLWSNFSLKLEYRFTQFDRESVIQIGPADIGLEPSIHAARLVASYRFNFGDHRTEVEPLK